MSESSEFRFENSLKLKSMFHIFLKKHDAHLQILGTKIILLSKIHTDNELRIVKSSTICGNLGK